MLITSQYALVLSSFMLFFLGFSTHSIAQSETTTDTKKTVIITKTIDDDGTETTTKIVTEGEEMSEEEINALIEKTLKEEGIEMDVDVRVDGDDKKNDDGEEVEKEIRIKMKSKDGKMEKVEGGDDEEIMIFKTDDGEVIKMKGKDMKMKEMEDGTEMIIEEEIIEEGGKIEKRIKKIKHAGHAPKGAFLGIMMDTETEGQVKVTETVEGSAAQKAGLQKGDVIKSLDGKQITSHQSLLDALSSKKVDDKVKIDYERAGKTMTTDAVLTAYKGEMKVIKMKKEGMEEGDHIWIEKDGDVIELEDGQKMILKKGEGKTTTTTKTVVKKKGMKKKTIEVEIEKEGKEKNN